MSRKTIQVAATYIGAVMGAGFASGQEIMQFFAAYGPLGILGIIIAGMLFAFMGWLILSIIKKYHIESYQELFRLVLGKKLGKACEILVTIFLFCGIVIMLAGSGAVFEEYFNLQATFGIILTTLAVLVALASKGEGVLWINTVLIPVKLLICLTVSFVVLKAAPQISISSIQFTALERPWFLSALLYVSFNLTFALVVLASLGREVRGNTAGGILGGLGLGIFALAIGSALLVYFPEVKSYQVPMVYIAYKAKPVMGLFYLLVLWFAMITAAVGNTFSFTKRVADLYPLSYWYIVLLTLGVAIPLSHLRFSMLVSIIYPAFGYIGLVIMGPLIYTYYVRR